MDSRRRQSPQSQTQDYTTPNLESIVEQNFYTFRQRYLHKGSVKSPVYTLCTRMQLGVIDVCEVPSGCKINGNKTNCTDPPRPNFYIGNMSYIIAEIAVVGINFDLCTLYSGPPLQRNQATDLLHIFSYCIFSMFSF